MYRYRETVNGVTLHSLSKLHHLDKLGILLSICGYRYRHKGVLHERVMVRGTNGSARFGGFCWGYWGEGPRGLQKLFDVLEIKRPVHTLPRNSCPGKDWEFWL